MRKDALGSLLQDALIFSSSKKTLSTKERRCNCERSSILALQIGEEKQKLPLVPFKPPLSLNTQRYKFEFWYTVFSLLSPRRLRRLYFDIDEDTSHVKSPVFSPLWKALKSPDSSISTFSQVSLSCSPWSLFFSIYRLLQFSPIRIRIYSLCLYITPLGSPSPSVVGMDDYP